MEKCGVLEDPREKYLIYSVSPIYPIVMVFDEESD
jgi:hypothetical protein